LDAFAGASNITFSMLRYGSLSEYRYKGRIVVLLKPSTYMNLSGKAVSYWMKKERIPPENLLVIVDDTALPFGNLRLRPRGNDGGHNGLISITEKLGHQEYARLRFGIGSEYEQGMQVDYVLGKWTPEQEKMLPERIKICQDIIHGFVTTGIDKTMNLYNNK